MAEIALRTWELKTVKEKYIAWRPKGSAIVVISEHEKRRKWLEIVCDLVSPKKRDKFKGIPGWQNLVDHWTQAFWDEWFELHKPTKKYPLGPILQNKGIVQQMWDNSIDAQLTAILGKESVGVEDLTKTWLWSGHERKTLFIVFNDDVTDAELEIYGLGTTLFKNGDAVMTLGAQYKYDFDVAISPDTLAKIQDPDFVIHPRFNIAVPKLKFSTPDVNDLVIP